MGCLIYIFVTSFILTIPCLDASIITTIDEIAGKLKTTKSLPEFNEELSKIDFSSVFQNKTIQTMVAPEYGQLYLMTLAKADNILQFIELPKARVDIQNGDGSVGSFLKSILENIDVLKVVGLVDWSKFILRSNGGELAQFFFIDSYSFFL